jgi:CubicO group peptidase (beta-lactamase class C family)
MSADCRVTPSASRLRWTRRRMLPWGSCDATVANAVSIQFNASIEPMKLTALILSISMAIPALIPMHVDAQDRFERVAAAEGGWSENGLESLRDFLADKGASAMLVLQGGRVVFEYGDLYRPVLVHSIRKALLSSLVGIHVREGDLDLDGTLADLGIEGDSTALSDAEQAATFRHILQSRSGVYLPAAAESPGMDRARPARGSHAPGAHFYYNNWDFNVAGAIFEQETDRSIFEAFRSEIAEPLGMLHFDGPFVSIAAEDDLPPGEVDGFYQHEPARSRFPAYHFRMSAHDLALYGQLMLQRGRWHGRQIVPADWIDESTKVMSITNERYGLAYGMLWNVLVPDDEKKTRPSFFHTGVGVHMLAVYPSLNLVFVLQVDTERPYTFSPGDRIGVIRRLHGARTSE